MLKIKNNKNKNPYMYTNTQFDPEYDRIQYELYIIFIYYCSFGDRENYSVLKIQNYRRMLSDAEVITDPESNPHFDVIYSSMKKRGGIDFKSFLESLPRIVKNASENTNLSDSMKKTIFCNFHTLYQYIVEGTDFGEDIKFINRSSFREQTFSVLRQLNPTLKQIYNNYFKPQQKKITQFNREQLFLQLTNFTKQFQITPHLLSKTCSYLIYTFLLGQRVESAYSQWFQQNSQNKFSYFKWIQYLVVCAQVANRKIYGVEVSDVRKIVSLLQRMQISRGFMKLCKKVHIKVHLIPQNQVLTKYERSPVRQLSPQKTSSPVKNTQTKALNASLLKNYSELKEKFVDVCSYGDTLQCSKLTHRKTLAILQELPYTQNEIQLMITSVSNTALTFEQFLELLNKISSERFIQLDGLIEMVRGINLDEEKSQTRALKYKQSELKLCQTMLDTVEPFLELLFSQYSKPIKIHNQFSFINLEDYIKLMYDLELIPNYVNKECTIVSFKRSLTKGYDFMTLQEFKESFLILITFVELNSIKMNQILVTVLETMNSSRAIQKIKRNCPHKSKEDYLHKFRSFFHSSYPQTTRDHSVTLRELLQS